MVLTKLPVDKWHLRIEKGEESEEDKDKVSMIIIIIIIICSVSRSVSSIFSHRKYRMQLIVIDSLINQQLSHRIKKHNKHNKNHIRNI